MYLLFKMGGNYKVFFKLIVVSIVIIYALFPGRFAVTYPYIPIEDIKYHLVPVYKPNSKSCPTLPELGLSTELQIKTGYYNKSTYANLLNVQKGGFWKPSFCNHVYEVAIIIPFRNRMNQLNIFLQYIHPFLQKHLISYRIFLIEQTFSKPFNRGALMNIGFVEALKFHLFHCFIFHDVDLLPLAEKNIYACTKQPRHLTAALNTWRYKLKYKNAFGGAVAILRDHFIQINGFSNEYFGWGGEDDDLLERY